MLTSSQSSVGTVRNCKKSGRQAEWIDKQVVHFLVPAHASCGGLLAKGSSTQNRADTVGKRLDSATGGVHPVHIVTEDFSQELYRLSASWHLCTKPTYQPYIDPLVRSASESCAPAAERIEFRNAGNKLDDRGEKQLTDTSNCLFDCNYNIARSVSANPTAILLTPPRHTVALTRLTFSVVGAPATVVTRTGRPICLLSTFSPFCPVAKSKTYE
ncbi:hypothetical protein ABW21_db0207711 [Orbilia brochopaga]|nr:hypothetical protein ABW21_db0207711 [Drechslerella brochopaga]